MYVCLCLILLCVLLSLKITQTNLFWKAVCQTPLSLPLPQWRKVNPKHWLHLRSVKYQQGPWLHLQTPLSRTPGGPGSGVTWSPSSGPSGNWFPLDLWYLAHRVGALRATTRRLDKSTILADVAGRARWKLNCSPQKPLCADQLSILDRSRVT